MQNPWYYNHLYCLSCPRLLRNSILVIGICYSFWPISSCPLNIRTYNKGASNIACSFIILEHRTFILDLFRTLVLRYNKYMFCRTDGEVYGGTTDISGGGYEVFLC